MRTEDQPRYAVYYAPEKGSDFAVLGSRWLGRDVETGLETVPLPVKEYTVREIGRITAAPGHYGLHATLKPPFRLARGVTEKQLCDFAESFAAEQAPFGLSGLEVRDLGSFLALMPPYQQDVSRLAEACVRGFEPFRGEPTLAEMEKYRQRGLPQRQTQYLAEWGYPFVLDEFVFHITLTDVLPDKKKRKKIKLVLEDLTKELRRQTHPVRELCVFHQPDRNSPFRILCRFPFGKGTDRAA